MKVLSYCRINNLLLDQPLLNQPDKVWAGEICSHPPVLPCGKRFRLLAISLRSIPFIPSGRGWLYLAVVIDLCTRRIIGWALAEHLRSELVTQAMEQAIGSNPRHCWAIFHRYRGSQYSSGAYRAGLRQSLPQCMD